MAQLALEASELVAFDNAAAGHEGVLSDSTGAVVVKPCTAAEIAFYESATTSHPDLAAYMPIYMGTLSLAPPEAVRAMEEAGEIATGEQDGSQLSTAGPADSHDSNPAQRRLHGKKLETGLAIALSNVADGFKRPNILDIKLGARLWDADAPPEKRARLDKVAAESTSHSLGFRIAGMRVWQGEDHVSASKTKPLSPNVHDESGYLVYDKYYGRNFDADNVIEGFKDFLYVPAAGITQHLGNKIAKRILDEAVEILKVLETKELRMVSASILCVYEGSREDLQTAFEAEEQLSTNQSLVQVPDVGQLDENDEGEEEDDDSDYEEDEGPKSVEVKLIDFAHARWTPQEGPDENTLQGVRGVIALLSQLLDDT